MATLGGYFDLPLVSYTSSADDLTDNARFPTFSRVNPNDLNSAALTVKVIQGFNWSHFSIVHVCGVEALPTRSPIVPQSAGCHLRG